MIVKDIVAVRIWIRIDFGRLDPDPRGQKLPTKIEKVKKFHVKKCLMFSFEGGQ